MGHNKPAEATASVRPSSHAATGRSRLEGWAFVQFVPSWRRDGLRLLGSARWPTLPPTRFPSRSGRRFSRAKDGCHHGRRWLRWRWSKRPRCSDGPLTIPMRCGKDRFGLGAGLIHGTRRTLVHLDDAFCRSDRSGGHSCRRRACDRRDVGVWLPQPPPGGHASRASHFGGLTLVLLIAGRFVGAQFHLVWPLQQVAWQD